VREELRTPGSELYASTSPFPAVSRDDIPFDPDALGDPMDDRLHFLAALARTLRDVPDGAKVEFELDRQDH
jgi:hypothetical protein